MKLTTILSTTVALALCLGASSGCDKSEEHKDDAEADSKVEAKKKAPVKDPVELLKAVKTPTLPGPLANLRFGMSAEEAKKAAPELEDGGKYLDEYNGAYFSYYIPDLSGKLESASLQIQGAEMAKLLTAAWGEPSEGVDLDKPKFFWFNEATKTRATVSEGFGKDDAVEFEAYLPTKELLGEGRETFGFEKADRPLLGATRDELTKNYADILEIMSKEELKKRRQELEILTGKDISTAVAAARNIDLPPTEYSSRPTRVHPNFDDDGTIDRVLVEIEWRPYPAAKDEILALIKAKWGEPKEEEKYGKTILIFNESPRVVVEEDTISKKWDIEMELAK